MEPWLFAIVGLFIVGMGFSLWALLAPDSWMRVDRLAWGWMLRDGYDTELSESGRSWIRIRGVIGIIATLVVCGVLLSLHADSVARDEAREEKQAREELLREAASAWGGGDIRIFLPTAGTPSDSITPEEVPATIIGFAPVTDDGATPPYLRELPIFRSSDLMTRDDDKSEVYASTDLLIGVKSPCDVSSVVVTSDDDRVVLEVVYASTRHYSFAIDCTGYSSSARLVPVELPEPLDGRAVELTDGTVLTEVRTPQPE